MDSLAKELKEDMADIKPILNSFRCIIGGSIILARGYGGDGGFRATKDDLSKELEKVGTAILEQCI